VIGEIARANEAVTFLWYREKQIHEARHVSLHGLPSFMVPLSQMEFVVLWFRFVDQYCFSNGSMAMMVTLWTPM